MKQKLFHIRAQGNSMFPLLRNGDTVEYLHVPFHVIKLNDIVLMYQSNMFVTHRVIYKTQTSCITRGDNNASADPPIKKGRIIAKVVRFKRRGAWHSVQDVYRAQSALYLHEIQKVETILRLYKVPHVFLKGVLISLHYEHTVPQRIYADCDILVRRSEWSILQNIFSLLGYTLQDKSLFTKQKDIQHTPEISYFKEVYKTLVVFDVHFEPVFLMTQLGGMGLLYPPKPLKHLGEQIITRGKHRMIQGSSYTMCDDPDQVLYLALHLFHHNYTDSVRYQLLDAVIRRSTTKEMWRALITTIKEYRLDGYVYLVFVLLKKYYKTPLPPSFIPTITPPPFKKWIAHKIAKRTNIFSQDTRAKAGITRFILIFLLSPEPMWKKIFLFVHPEVVHTELRLAQSFLISHNFLSYKQIKK